MNHKKNMSIRLFLLSLCMMACVCLAACSSSSDEEKPVEATTQEAAAETTTAATTEAEVEDPYIIVIDAGHGGNDSGVMYESESGWKEEKKIAMKIAKYMREELETFKNVEVHFSRKEDVYVALQDRADYAKRKNADLMISLHLNSMEDAGGYAEGLSIAVAAGTYDKYTSAYSKRLGCNFAYELEQLGIKNNGLIMHSSKDYDYPNGRPADFYALIRSTLPEGIATIIVEHGFLDNANDYDRFFNTDEKLKKIGIADAHAVARYLQVEKKDTGEVLEELKNYNINCHRTTRSGGTTKYKKTYYKTNEE